MLKRVEVENFKSLKKAVLEPGKLTILTGMNSAGKTSMLQSLAFLKQSIAAKEATYDGNLVRLGSFKDVIFNHDMSLNLHIVLNVELKGKEITYDVKTWADRVREEFYVGEKLNWGWDSRSPGVVEPFQRIFLGQAAKGYGGGEYNPELTPEEIGETQVLQRALLEWFDNLIPLAVVRGFTKYAYPLLAGPPQMGEVAKRSGELQLLEEWLSSLILYRVNESRRDPSLRPLLDKVGERLGRLGVEISPYILGGPSVVIDLIEDDLWVSAVNAGYGINQIVPAVTLGTLSLPGSLVTIEEPEIHLHPKTQKKVADILCEIAEEGKQLIFSTHSPFLVNTIHQRYLEQSPLDVRLFYVEKIKGVANYSRFDIKDPDILAKCGLELEEIMK